VPRSQAKATSNRGALVAAELPNWYKTPFIPLQSVKGRGVDCKGFHLGVARELGFPEAESEYAKSLDYSLTKPHGVPSAKLREGFAALFDRVDAPRPVNGATDELEAVLKPGDILLCKWGGKPAHIALWDGNRAWNAIPYSGVKPRTLRCLFHRFPFDSIWRWK
jgi:hypothetical protein